MLNPMVRAVTQELVAVKDSAMARYATESSSSAIEPEQRRAASDKRAYHRNLREAFLKISESPEDFILVATQPLQSFPVLGALDTTVQLIPRDDNETARCRGAARRLAGPSRVRWRSRLASRSSQHAEEWAFRRWGLNPPRPSSGSVFDAGRFGVRHHYSGSRRRDSRYYPVVWGFL